MRVEIVEWSLTVLVFLRSVAVEAFSLVLVASLVLAIFRRTRWWGGQVLYVFSFLVGAITWFCGVAASFASFGWFGLIIGLLFLGLGVVPLGIIGGFVYLDSSIGLQLIFLIIITFALRMSAVWLMARGR